MAKRIEVNIADSKPYDIVIERGLLQRLGQDASEFGLDGRVIVGTNTTLAPLYGQQLVTRLPNADITYMEDGEEYKNLDTISRFYDQFLKRGADRHTTVLALGGGVVGDAVGFVAASFMRGVRFVQAPTSLLAMVDSSVGGKVGIDLPQGKNLVGAFKQPQAVLIDPDVLETLPKEQWRCGMGEILKHGFIADEGLLDEKLHRKKFASELVARAVQVKVNIVEEDPYEHSVRAYLNLGHTFGHAIEQVTQYAWMHGDAVGFGLMAAATLSHELGMIDDALLKRVRRVLAEAELPRHIRDIAPDAIWDAMITDKKWKNGVSRFVLLEGMNRPTIVEGIERDIVVKVLEKLQR
ncbi:MAG: 3-dehydroquinate synthase [Phototrophicaceae bacterium]